MARDWPELFITDGAEPQETAQPPERERRGFFTRLRDNLTKTRRALSAEVHATLFDEFDEETWERLEEALIAADVGARTTAHVVERLEREATESGLSGGEELTNRLIDLLADAARPSDDGDDRIDLRHKPTVVLMVGVNGTGKTATIGKLAWHLRQQLGHTVLIAAADTYRAAAVEQLERWAQRAGCDIVTGGEGQDPGSVAFDAIAAGTARGVDVIIVDTAGRLHTQDQFMAELGKVAHVSGIVLTKLDGTAKGGIALAIADELDIPVKLIGTGEQLEDLRPFDPPEFARALL